MKISQTLMLSLILGTQTLIAQDNNYRKISRYEMIAYENDSNCIVTLIKSEIKGDTSVNYVKIEDKKTKQTEKVIWTAWDCLGCGRG